MNRILLIFLLMAFSVAGFAVQNNACRIEKYQTAFESTNNKKYYIYRCQCNNKYAVSDKANAYSLADLGYSKYEKCKIFSLPKAKDEARQRVANDKNDYSTLREQQVTGDVGRSTETTRLQNDKDVALVEKNKRVQNIEQTKMGADFTQADSYMNGVYNPTYDAYKENYNRQSQAISNIDAKISDNTKELSSLTEEHRNKCFGNNPPANCTQLSNDIRLKEKRDNELLAQMRTAESERNSELDKAQTLAKETEKQKIENQYKKGVANLDAEIVKNESESNAAQAKVNSAMVNEYEDVMKQKKKDCKDANSKSNAECRKNYKNDIAKMEGLSEDQKSNVIAVLEEEGNEDMTYKEAIEEAQKRESADIVTGEMEGDLETEGEGNFDTSEETKKLAGKKGSVFNCEGVEIVESEEFPSQTAGNPEACNEVFKRKDGQSFYDSKYDVSFSGQRATKHRVCKYIDNMESTEKCDEVKEAYIQCENVSNDVNSILLGRNSQERAAFLEDTSTSCGSSAVAYSNCANDNEECKKLNRGPLEDNCTKKLCEDYYMKEVQVSAKEKGYRACRKAQTNQFVNEIARPCMAYNTVAQLDEDELAQDSISSFDGRFACNKVGRYTADYKSCKKIVQFYNASFIGEQGMQVAQQGAQIGHQNKMNRIIASGEEDQAETDKAAAEAAADEEVDPTQTGFTVAGPQGEGVDRQKAAFAVVKQTNKFKGAQETAKAAFYGTKAAVLGGMLAGWVTPKNLSNKCGNNGLDSERCLDAANYEGKHRFTFPNADIKGAFMMDMFQAVGKATMAGILASDYYKQAKIVKNFEDDYKQYEQQNDDPVFEIDPCMQNPNLAQCKTRGTRNTITDFQQNSLNFDSGGSNEYGVMGDEDLVVGDENDDFNSIADQKVIDDISDMFDNSKKKKTGNENHAPSAAKLGEGGAPSASGAGGGGAGGGGGGGAAGGSGAKRGGKGGPAKVAAKTGGGYGKKKWSSSGASGYGKGGGSGRRKKSKGGNLFGNAFNKKSKSRGVASMNVGVAPKTSSLFKSISKRYNRVHRDKRIRR